MLIKTLIKFDQFVIDSKNCKKMRDISEKMILFDFTG